MKRPVSKGTFSGDTFKRLDLKQAMIADASFSECKFTRCDFSDAQLLSCRFLDCSFEDCTMRMLKLEDTSLIRVKFTRCNLLGIQWTEANWSDWAAKTGALAFDGCDLKYGSFLGLDLKKLHMKACTAHEVNFAEAKLSEGDFEGTDFAGAVFLRTDMTKANFVGAKNYTISVHDNKTKGARFALPEAIRLLYALDVTIIDPKTNEVVDEDGVGGLM